MTAGAVTTLAGTRGMDHGEQLSRIARKYPERTAYICNGESRTFGEVDRRVTSLARAFTARGLHHGDRLALLMMNSIEMIEAMFAGWRVGAIVVPVNFRLVANEVGFILRDCGASVIVVDEGLSPLVGAVRDTLPDVRAVVVLGEAASAGPGAERFGDLLHQPGDTPVTVAVDEQDPALIMYTSGTTGRPKGAVLSHFNLLMSTLNAMVSQGIVGYDDVWYGNLPLFHIGGLTGILPYVMGGGCAIIVPSGNFDSRRAVEEMARFGVTGCVFVGMQWDEICDEVTASGAHLSLRRASWGAANTPVEVLAKIERALPGVPVFSFFGQTEMSPVTCVLRAVDSERKRGSVGRPIMNVEARVVDEDGNDVAVGEVGEIVYRGPTVMQGYWRMPETNEQAFADGWFHSGDLCRMDDEGYVYVVDRKTDMIISGGENIYCPEVEAVLRAHPGVVDAALIGLPDPKWGETPRAVIVPVDPDDPPEEAALIAWCKERLASYKKPTSVVVVDQFPLNSAGKVLKPALRERFGQR
jgi:acyl-CoA synthetase (AMP-forming)/AMP-acid ligase II